MGFLRESGIRAEPASHRPENPIDAMNPRAETDVLPRRLFLRARRKERESKSYNGTKANSGFSRFKQVATTTVSQLSVQLRASLVVS